MKKIFRYAAMICAAALAVACAEEPQDEPIVEHPTTKDLTITTEATTPDSRVLFADGEGFAWENADLTKMAVCYNEELLWKHTCSTSGAINEGIASFTATVNAESVFAYCYYPYAENNSTDSTFAYNFAANVAQSEAGKTTALRLASDVISIEGEANNVAAQFRIVGSLLRYFIYAEESDERVESVALKATAPVAGSYTYNLASAEGTVGGNTSNEVTVTLGTALSLDGITAADKAKSVFMPIVPTTSQGVTYVVTTDKNVYEFVSDAAHTWAEGSVTEIKLNLAKATNVTPIGGGEPEEPKLQLYYLFREKTGGYCAKAVSVESAGQTLMNNAWFLVGVGGNSDDKLILSDYQNQAPYRDLRFECPEWMEYTHDGGQNISLKVLENTTTEERVGTFKIYSNVDTEVYEVVYADGETITIEDPVFEVTVTQAGAAEVNPDPDPEPDPSGATELTYHFTNKAMRTSYDVAANEGAAATDYFIVALNGVDNTEYSKPYYTDLRMEYLDEEGNKVDWITFTTRANDNKLDYSWTTNEGAARTAIVNIYWDDTEEYKVVATVKNDAKELQAITTTDPIMTIKVNQAAGAATPDPEPDPEPSGATTLYYHFTDKGVSALHYDIMATGETKGLGWYSCYVGGTDTADGNLPAFKNWRMQAVDANGNVVDWITASPFSNTIDLTCAANTGEARSATVNFYWDDTEEFVVIGTIKTADRTPYDIASGNFTSADPILTITINQEGKSSEPTTLYYHFTDKGIGALHHEFTAAGQMNKNLGWYSCFIGGKDNATGTNACFQQWIAKAYDENGNEVDWVYATPVPDKNEVYLSCEANAGDARTATVKLYWVDNEDFVVIGTIKTADRTPYDIASGNFTSADPILELTVNQAAGN